MCSYHPLKIVQELVKNEEKSLRDLLNHDITEEDSDLTKDVYRYTVLLKAHKIAASENYKKANPFKVCSTIEFCA